MTSHHTSRRHLLGGAASLLALAPFAAYGQQQRIPIADVHSHYGMFSRRLAESGLAEDMRKSQVAIVAWKLVADRRFTRVGATGIEQFREPVAGELSLYFQNTLEQMRAYIAEHKLKLVLTSADVDACIAGEPGIVLAAEGADFLEGRVDPLDAAYRNGLRHLQLVHYIRTPVGDLQSNAPVHNGLSVMGKQLIEACNAKGVLIDLAHSTMPAVDQALEISKAPVIWSHGWVDGDGGHWRDPFGFLKRRLSVAHARKIAKGGGVVGLWGLGVSRPGLGYSVTMHDARAYASEIKRLMDRLGAEHVALGTDIEGLGQFWAVNDYSHVRTVIDHLHDMKVPSADIERVAYRNYARVLKSVLKD